MALTPGTHLGAYEILALLGAGGMGEVYRARDQKLDRDVAIKVLAESLAQDSVTLARFHREAKVVAALSHPNILSIHDFGTESVETGARIEYAVMELLEGETLRKKLEVGPVSPRKAIDYGLQVAHGLAAAHDKGIVHRDLKPENLFVVKDGHVKILDFGLAHLRHASLSPAAASVQTIPWETTPGLILGTVPYMSPEQVRAHDVDWRSDIFTLGVVLYEMLSGQRPFRGDSVADTMGAILKEDPADFPHTSLLIPAVLDRLIRRCLEKDPGERFQSARDLAFALEAITGTSTSSGAAPPLDVREPGRVKHRSMWAAVGVVVGLIIGVTPQFVAWLQPAAAPSPVRLNAVVPGNDILDLRQTQGAIALSPDGQTLVYSVGVGPNQHLDRRSMRDGQVAPIPSSNGVTNPFFSPDGQWLAFTAGGGVGGATKLWKVPTSGGVRQALCDQTAGVGGSWGDDGTIVFAPSPWDSLWRVPAAGGTCEQLTTLGKDESSHGWPDVLPGARAVIYTAEVSGQPFDNARIMIRPLPSGQPRALIEGGSGARYARSGHLLFGRANRLMAAPFDVKRLAVTGPAVPILESVSDEPSVGAVRFALSNQGTLAYVAGGGPHAQRSLVWVDRGGATQRVTDIGRLFVTPRLSPDGKQIALRISAANEDLWLYDLNRSTLSRLTSQGENFNPSWTSDGKRLMFVSNRTGPFNLFWMPADDSGNVEQVSSDIPGQTGFSLSPDGKAIAFVRNDPKTAQDIWMMRLESDRTPRPIARTAFSEQGPRIAPDGRRIAYQSNESGQYEVYVQAFPGPGPKRQVSVNGGVGAEWGRDGRELFFIQGDTLMAAPVELGESFSAGKPRVLFPASKFLPGFDPAPDGRFLMVQRSDEEASTRQIDVILNWFEELKARVPTK